MEAENEAGGPESAGSAQEPGGKGEAIPADRGNSLTMHSELCRAFPNESNQISLAFGAGLIEQAPELGAHRMAAHAKFGGGLFEASACHERCRQPGFGRREIEQSPKYFDSWLRLGFRVGHESSRSSGLRPLLR